METFTIYQHDEFGYFTGGVSTTDKYRGIPRRWSAVPLPTIPEGQFAQLNGNSWNIVAAKPVPSVEVPASVSRRQAKQQLAIAGLLASVQPAIDSIEDAQTRVLTQIFWDDSQEFERSNQYLGEMASRLQLTDEQLDDLFIAAATL